MRKTYYSALCVITLVLFVALSARPAYAQGKCYAAAPETLLNLVTQATGRVIGGDDGSNDFDALVLYTMTHAVTPAIPAGSVRRDLAIHREETARTDKQITAASASNAITSLASKTNFSTLLGLAVEHEGVQKEVKDSVLTLSTSPYAFIAAVSGDTAETYQNNDFFRRIGASAQFSISAENDVLASAHRQQLQSWSMKFRLSPDRSTRSIAFEKYWAEKIAPKAMARDLAITGGLATIFSRNADMTTWRVSKLALFKTRLSTAMSRAGAAPSDVSEAILCFLETDVFNELKNGTMPLTTGNRAQLSTIGQSLSAAEVEVNAGKEELEARVKELSDAYQFTLAYDNTRVADGGDYSTGRLLYSRNAFAPLKLVMNLYTSLYHHPDRSKNQQTLRDLAAVLSFEGKGGRSPFASDPNDKSQVNYSFSGSYKRVMENRHTAKLKADIAAVQFKLSLPIQSGFEFPIAFTYANTTEDMHKREARAEFGLTLDLDKLRELALAAVIGKAK